MDVAPVIAPVFSVTPPTVVLLMDVAPVIAPVFSVTPPMVFEVVLPLEKFPFELMLSTFVDVVRLLYVHEEFEL